MSDLNLYLDTDDATSGLADVVAVASYNFKQATLEYGPSKTFFVA